MKQPLGSFFREVWRTERQLPGDKAGYHRVGHDGWPERELVRFRSSQHMASPGRMWLTGKCGACQTGCNRLS